jgi:hypothetical protein
MSDGRQMHLPRGCRNACDDLEGSRLETWLAEWRDASALGLLSLVVLSFGIPCLVGLTDRWCAAGVVDSATVGGGLDPGWRQHARENWSLQA